MLRQIRFLRAILGFLGFLAVDQMYGINDFIVAFLFQLFIYSVTYLRHGRVPFFASLTMYFLFKLLTAGRDIFHQFDLILLSKLIFYSGAIYVVIKRRNKDKYEDNEAIPIKMIVFFVVSLNIIAGINSKWRDTIALDLGLVAIILPDIISSIFSFR